MVDELLVAQAQWLPQDVSNLFCSEYRFHILKRNCGGSHSSFFYLQTIRLNQAVASVPFHLHCSTPLTHQQRCGATKLIRAQCDQAGKPPAHLQQHP